MVLSGPSCFISQFHFMTCFTCIDGSVARRVVYGCVCVCVCVWPVLLAVRCYYFRLLFGCKLYVVLRFARVCMVYCLYSPFKKKSDSRPMYKQRRRSGLSVEGECLYSSPHLLSSRDWKGTRDRKFCFRNAWWWNETGKRISLSLSVLHGTGMLP